MRCGRLCGGVSCGLAWWCCAMPERRGAVRSRGALRVVESLVFARVECNVDGRRTMLMSAWTAVTPT